MILRTPDIGKKQELERQGFVCRGMHNIYKQGSKGQEPTGLFEYEFELPDVIEEEIQEEPVKKRGNPNWLKRGKK